jgi:hypothetical protein
VELLRHYRRLGTFSHYHFGLEWFFHSFPPGKEEEVRQLKHHALSWFLDRNPSTLGTGQQTIRDQLIQL